jgi:hypothetical protein
MTDMQDERQQQLLEAIKEFNDTLVTQSINLSGQAFNNALRLGCGLLIVPLIIILAVTHFVRGLDFSAVFVFSCAAFAIAIVFAAAVSNRAKYLAAQEKYQQDVNPEIVKFLAENDFTRAQFDAAADDILGDNAPLREYLVRPSSKEGDI